MSDCLYLLVSEWSFHLHFTRFTPRTTERSRFRDPPRRGPPPLPPIFTTPRPTTTVAAPSDSLDSQRIESNQAITNDVTSLFDVLAEGDNDYQELVPPAFWHLPKAKNSALHYFWIFQSKLHINHLKWNETVMIWVLNVLVKIGIFFVMEKYEEVIAVCAVC